jgi:thiosulfate/3-mercaptopyruvate sulfurtransferase
VSETIELPELRSRLRDDDLTLLDVRTDVEHEGTDGYPCDPRQGHIPGSMHLDVAELLEASPDQLRKIIGLPPGAEVIAYCHSGARSGLAANALRAAGYNARNYVGSWHEWSRHDDLPAETGASG